MKPKIEKQRMWALQGDWINTIDALEMLAYLEADEASMKRWALENEPIFAVDVEVTITPVEGK